MELALRTFRRNDYKLTSPFGMRKHPITLKWSMHNGCDYWTLGEKWAQYALEDGEVVSAGIDYAGNKAIFAWIYYPRLKIRVLHYHLDKVFVKKGQKVNANTIIGNTGTTGDSTNVHLHIGVKVLKNGTWTYVDPISIDYKEEGLSINGLLDEETIKALQRRLGTTADGIISKPSSMVKELQRRLISGEKI